MKATLLITSYKRPHLLKWGLASIARQNFNKEEVDIIVLNDGIEDETESICNSFSDKIKIKYIYTGKRNKEKEVWRCPGFAFNIGAKNTDSDFIFLSCAEMYHLDETISQMIEVLKRNSKLLTIPIAKDDNGDFLKSLENNLLPNFNSQPPLINVKLPFFMGLNRIDFMSIGGYDEDFVGTDFDDNDIVDRLLYVGNRHQKVNSRVVHLWHERSSCRTAEGIDRFNYNKNLYNNRRNKAIRNINKEWGKL